MPTSSSTGAMAWKKLLQSIRDKMQSSMYNNTLRRDDPALQKLGEMITDVQLLDLSRLTRLMKQTLQVGEQLKGKDVFLLCGEAGSGKTTTLQFLLGTTFAEVEIDGFLHLKPHKYSSPQHAQFETSYSSQGVTTECLQAAKVTVDGISEVVICDVPSSDGAGRLEDEVTLGLGIVKSIQCAKSIRPVVVISREGMGNRFRNLPETMRAVRRLFPNVKCKADMKPFAYVFTKYDDRHRSMLHKQFAALLRNPPRVRDEEKDIFQAFIEDIVEKTDPEARVVVPTEELPAQFLKSLYISTDTTKVDPKDLCQPLVANNPSKQLELHMKLALHDFHAHILQENYAEAITRLHSMVDATNLFSQMEPVLKLAEDQYLHQVTQLWMMVVQSIGKEDYLTALYRMEQLNNMAADFPDASECASLGQDLLSKSVTQPITKGYYSQCIRRLILLSKLEERFPGASDAVDTGLSKLKEQVASLIREKEFEVTADIIKQLGKAESSIPDAFVVTQHGLHLLRECLLNMIQEENYDDGIPLALSVIELGKTFSEVNAHIKRILKTLRRRLDNAIQTGNFEDAANLLLHVTSVGTSLTGASEHVEGAVNSAARYACELRMDVVHAFEDLLQTKDPRKYKQLLVHAHGTVAELISSEDMRIICSNFYKAKSASKSSSASSQKSNQPDYLTILCTPKDCTNNSFVLGQIRHLVDSLKAEFDAFEQESLSMEYMMENRKKVLSVMLRLRSTRTIFRNSPGSDVLSAQYDVCFTKFQKLIETMLTVSENSFESSMDMKEFEFQAWFLAFLVQGFTRDRDEKREIDLSDDMQAIEELDHRRVTLMLRFENAISDTMDLIKDYNFPKIRPPEGSARVDFTKYFQEVSLSELEAPRHLLSSLSDAPKLCEMMATVLSVHDAEAAVASLDKSVLYLFQQITSYFEESTRTLIQAMKTKRVSLSNGFRTALGLSKDIAMIHPQFEVVQSWSLQLQTNLRQQWSRIKVIENCLGNVVAYLHPFVAKDEDISPIAFLGSLVPLSGDGCSCACLSSCSEHNEILANLPVLDQDQQISYDRFMFAEESKDAARIIESGGTNFTSIKEISQENARDDDVRMHALK